jgi:hypothetical protein
MAVKPPWAAGTNEVCAVQYGARQTVHRATPERLIQEEKPMGFGFNAFW